MPMYGYKCEECGTPHEALRKFNQEAPVCPSCGAPADKQEKQVSTGSTFLLMGYGWTKNGMSTTGRK